MKSDLDSKLNVIFQNYGIELEQVQQLYDLLLGGCIAPGRARPARIDGRPALRLALPTLPHRTATDRLQYRMRHIRHLTINARQ